MYPPLFSELPHSSINPGVPSPTFLPEPEKAGVLLPGQLETDGILAVAVKVGDLNVKEGSANVDSRLTPPISM